MLANECRRAPDVCRNINALDLVPECHFMAAIIFCEPPFSGRGQALRVEGVEMMNLTKTSDKQQQ
eukprot:m.286726 g.286726  ORF g.286726 m.286726 type:complete len:65 (-) comp161751_c0_seq1:13-207(-)